MIVVMNQAATLKQIGDVIQWLDERSVAYHVSRGEERTVIGLLGQTAQISREALLDFPGVDDVLRISKPFKMASRDFHPEDTVVRVNGFGIGAKGSFFLIAGPCSIESREHALEVAEFVHAQGAHMLRGGAFKPRSSPYSFQGLGEEGLRYLAEARERTGLPIVTEVLSGSDVDLVSEYADMLQIGARNMQNFPLLKAVGEARLPVLLKRGLSATIEEFLLASEYILAGGNSQVVLCERGIRTFETYTRNTLDISAVPVIKELSHLPIIVDPSHAAGKRSLVPALAKAGSGSGRRWNHGGSAWSAGESDERWSAESGFSRLCFPDERDQSGSLRAATRQPVDRGNREMKRIAIVGLGQIGGSIVQSLRKRRAPYHLTGIDVSRKRLRLLSHELDSASSKWEDTKNSNLIVLCLHFAEILEFLRHASREVLMMDVCSSKQAIVQLASRRKLRFIGGHPLAGNERSGERGWDADLFSGAPFFLCSTTGHADLPAAKRLVRFLGAKPKEIGASQHDRYIALTSQFPAFLSVLLEKTASAAPALFHGPGYRSMTRLARTDPELFRTFLESNRKNIVLSAREFRHQLDEWIRNHKGTKARSKKNV